MIFPRSDVVYISPEKEVNAGLWTLFTGSTLFLFLRIWCKYTRRTGLWYDDYILILSWLVLMTTDIIISIEFATGYVEGDWSDSMHILINISSCGTLVGQALSKTAFGVTLLRMSNRYQMAILWLCIATMNVVTFIKVLFQWAKYCGRDDYQQWYRLQGFCIGYGFEQNLKQGGNVINIIMDFIFALIPWWITWPLEMKRNEKIGLGVTMSLGMIIATFSAVRTAWKYTDKTHDHDDMYMWRNGMSMVWYSAEVAGTIIVQCIPILRPFLRDIHTSLTSRKLGDTENGGSMTNTWRSVASRSRRSTMDGKRSSTYLNNNFDNGKGKMGTITEVIALGDIREEKEVAVGGEKKTSYSISSDSPSEKETDQATPTTTASPLWADGWRLSGSEHTGIHSSQEGDWFNMDQHRERGLSPPPKRVQRP